jgi:phosphatidylserine/phosphatidylglycerophosphate/cardiolipin synthase-like enzyme
VDFVRPVRRVPLSLVAGRGHYESVIEAVMAAETSVWIATANLKELQVEYARRTGRRRNRRGRGAFRSVIEVFDELANKGVELRILHATVPSRAFRDEFDRHPELVAGGLELRLCPRVHFKAVVVDGRSLYLGSANWTGAGLGAKGVGRRNFELGLVTEDETLLDEVQAYFDRIWRGAECKGCRLRDRCDAPLDLEAPRSRLRVV